MILTGSLARAAPALVGWPRERVAQLSGVSLGTMSNFEGIRLDPGKDARRALQAALEKGGAVLLAEAGCYGAGVRLKIPHKGVKQINLLESEGAAIGVDDV